MEVSSLWASRDGGMIPIGFERWRIAGGGQLPMGSRDGGQLPMDFERWKVAGGGQLPMGC